MRLTISTRLGGAILAMLILLLACGGAGYFAATKLSGGLDYVTTTAWDAADGAMEGTIGLQGQIITLDALGEADDDATIRELKKRLDEDMALEEESLTRMIGSGLFNDEIKTELAQMRAEFADVRSGMLKAIDRHRENNNAGSELGLMMASESLAETVVGLFEFLGKMEELGDSKVESYATELETVKSVSFSLLIGTVVVGVVLGLLALMMVIRSVIDPIKHVAARFIEIAEGEGDLTVSLPENGNDEITDVSRGFNMFVSKTRRTIQNVVNASNQINDSVSELSQINSSTSQSIGRQQRETDQVATAMNEMVATVQEVARNVSDAASAAHEANDEAIAGKEIVAGTIDKIDHLACEVQQAAQVLHRVEDDSQKVGTVLDVIKDIAEQTNLLALNAAIEAARAGEQGRGFAVVADEVRTLAGRTQQSTEEIQKMIESLQSGTREAVDVMERGQEMTGDTVDQANKAGEALQAIADAVSTITNMTAQVASAAEEQNSVAEEINNNIVNISNHAHETGEASNSSGSATDRLSSLALQLKDAVSHFRI